MGSRLTLLSFSILMTSSILCAQSATQLLADMDNIIFGPKDKQGTIEIILINKSGKEKIREAAMFQKGADRRLYRYTKPESQAGIATLSLPGDVMWLYLPAFGKPKKISLLAKSQAFTGTDFSYEDMATKPYSDRFSPSILANDNNQIRIELTPRSNKSHYSKIVVTLDPIVHYPKSMEYYDKSGKKFKEAKYRYNKIGKYWNAEEVIMINIRKLHQTKIRLTNIKFDQGISDDLFTVEKMKVN